MKKNQLILIGIGIVLLVSLYFFGQRHGASKSPGNAPMAATRDMPANPLASVKEIDIDAYEKENSARLSSELQQQAAQLSEKALRNPTALTFKDLAEFWEKQKDLNIAAKYYKKAAFLENTEKSITFAGNLFLAVMQKTDQPEFRKWQALEAAACFNKALELNPENVESKIALATCYTEGTGETMKGVLLLREVTQKDSNNVSANIILGKLAIQSGQLDKAIKRLEHVLDLRPDNTEAMYFLAEAYKGKGNKEKAIEWFEQCKKRVNNPDFSKEIDQYIATFK